MSTAQLYDPTMETHSDDEEEEEDDTESGSCGGRSASTFSGFFIRFLPGVSWSPPGVSVWYRPIELRAALRDRKAHFKGNSAERNSGFSAAAFGNCVTDDVADAVAIC